MAVFPPAGPVTVLQTIPSYLYVQYADDDDLQAFVAGYNGMAQYYVDWFNQVGIPVYTGLTGSLLDWVAQGLYGIVRPTLESVGSIIDGPLNTSQLNTIVLDYWKAGTASDFFLASDDVFKRVITWHFYKGDGKVFSIPWLKRRTLRFLKGANGSAPNVADTSQISVTISGDFVTINLTAVTGVDPSIITAFLYVVEGGIVELPPQYVFEVIT